MSDTNLEILAPTITDREVETPLFCGPGPCNVWPSVNEALSKPVLSPICDEYFNVIDDIRNGIKYIFQTKSKLVLAVSGSGHTGMETIITNLVGPGETLFIATRGIWDERAQNIAARYGIKTIVYRVEPYETFKIAELERSLQRIRPTALFVTHGDSSTGSIQDIKEIGRICHRYGTLLLVDTVVSLVGVPFFMDKWEVDAVYTSTQKALSGPAGISPVAFSELAQEKINNRKHEPPFYFDIKLLSGQWNCYGNTRTYHHTLSPPLLWALRACLQEVCKETLPVAWARHEATVAHFHKRLAELPLKFFVREPSSRLPTVTTLELPKGYEIKEFNAYIRKKHNIVIFGGLGPTFNITIRIGIMGVNATKQVADKVIEALSDALRTLGKGKL